MLGHVAEVSGRTRHARELFAPLGPTYDRYARLLSFGQDPRWRSFLVSRIPADAWRAQRAEVLDLLYRNAPPARVNKVSDFIEQGKVREALEGCELILLIVDAKKKWDRDDAFVLDLAKKAGTPVFLLLNKIDLLANKSKLLPLIAQFQTLHDFKEIVPISALKKKGLDELLA